MPLSLLAVAPDAAITAWMLPRNWLKNSIETLKIYAYLRSMCDCTSSFLFWFYLGSKFYEEYCLSFPAAISLRVWVVGWVGNVNTISEPTGGDKWCLAGKVTFLYCVTNSDASNATVTVAAATTTTTTTTTTITTHVQCDRQPDLALIPSYTISASHNIGLYNAVVYHRE
jgi:hypothetical protein